MRRLGRSRTLVLLAVAALPLAPLAAQPDAPATKLDLRQIMADPEWLGRPAESPYWGGDSLTVYFSRQRAGSELRDLWRLRLDDEEARPLEDRELSEAEGDRSRYDVGGERRVWSRDGDLYWQDLRSGERRQLTRTAESESDPRLLLDGRVAFRRGDRILVRDLESGLEEEPFVLRLEQDPEARRQQEREQRDYVSRRQEHLFEFVRERDRRRVEEQERRRQQLRDDPSTTPPPFHLGDDVEIEGLALSPSGRHLLLTLVPKERERGRAASMPDWITDSGYIEPREVRPKVGTGKPWPTRVLLLDRESGESVELDLGRLPGIAEDPLAELRAAAEKRRERERTARRQEDDDISETGDTEDEDLENARRGDDVESPQPRPVRITDLTWSPDGKRALFQAWSFDNKDRWIATVDPAAAELTPVRRIHDPAWLGWDFRDVGWTRDGERIWYLSEESGYSHVHRIRWDGSDHRQLTEGDFLVEEPEPGREGRHLYLRANAGHPGIYEIWRLDLESGDFERLTDLGGNNHARVSPDERWLLITHSSATRPPELFLQPTTPGASARQLTSFTSDEFLDLPWVAPEYVEVPSSQVKRPIHARLYRPSTPAPPGGRPAVLFVHGAGYLQNAHQGWSRYFREFMFHSLLVERGYVVLDMDYRASAGYGRDWRTAIYRQMGKSEVEDLADGVTWLVENHDVDRARVGVYGGSYGGFLTFMALFTEPDLFAAGAALRPVTDWAHYNHPYTSNILNTPDLDPEAYERSSPIEYAGGLAAPLLICAPMLDDNVFFLDSVRLVQRLIELEKEDWEIALYPVEPHGFREPSSWLDEYRRILKLFERHLGPSPSAELLDAGESTEGGRR